MTQKTDMSRAKTLYPADPAPILEAIHAAAPFFTEAAVMIGYLAMMAATENGRQKENIYTLEYYGGKWVVLKWRDYVYAGENRRNIVPLDTDATSVVSLTGALASMRAEAERAEAARIEYDVH